jgi:hypothetical protein
MCRKIAKKPVFEGRPVKKRQATYLELPTFMRFCRFMHKKLKPFFQRLGMLKNATFFLVLKTLRSLHGTLSLYF